MPSGRRHLVACAVVVALAASAACAHEPSARPGTPATYAAQSPAPGSFGGTDLAWIEVSIAMDEQVSPLLGLARRHSRNASVKRLNAQVKAFTDAELGTLRRLHDEARLPAQNPHEGMPMPGMVQRDDVADAAALSGRAFDTRLLSLLRAHLEQGASLATSELRAGRDPDTLRLAKQVLRTRTTYLPDVRTPAGE